MTNKLIKLVIDLWSFIENAGSTEEFFALRERVRDMQIESESLLCERPNGEAVIHVGVD